MATRKPKVAPKATKPAATKSTAVSTTGAQARAKKVTAKETKVKPVSEIVALVSGTFVKFLGYVNETPEEDQLFEKGDVLYIASLEEATDDSALTYQCISGKDVATFLADPEDENLEGQPLVIQEIQEISGRGLNDAHERFLSIPSVGDLDAIIEESGGDLIEASRSVFGRIEQSFFYLGGILARLRREGAHLVENGGEFEGDSAWDEFCQKEFNFSGAKGGDLARMYSTFAAIEGFDPSKLSEIGWSKVREIQRFVTDENYEALIEDARTLTRDELKVQLSTKYVDEAGRTPSGAVAQRTGGRNAIKTMTLTFKMVEDNATAVELALAEARKLYGVDTDSEALSRIIMSWAEEHVASATKQKRIQSKIAKADKAAAAPKAPRQRAAA